ARIGLEGHVAIAERGHRGHGPVHGGDPGVLVAVPDHELVEDDRVDDHHQEPDTEDDGGGLRSSGHEWCALEPTALPRHAIHARPPLSDGPMTGPGPSAAD